MTKHSLSKSKLLLGLQCLKRLWLEVHRPELKPEDAQLEAQFEAGHNVGETARHLAGDGVLIEALDFASALAETRKHVQNKAPLLFEAAFEADRVRVRADILHFNRGRHDVSEVKSSTSVKDYHYQDAAIQKWVMKQAGDAVGSISIQHLDGDFVYRGDGNYQGIFQSVDVTKQIRPLLAKVPEWIAEARRALSRKEPAVPMGAHCGKPWPCPFASYCEGLAPAQDLPLNVLPNSGRTVPKLLAEGYETLDMIPEGRLTERQERVRIAHVTGKPFYDPAVRKIIASIGYPRAYLDFETIGFPIPVWKGTSPWQAVPFQFSLVAERSRGAIRKHDFADLSGQSPAEPLIDALLTALPDSGPILAYNAGTEARCLELLAKLVPKHAKPLRRARKRLVDVLPITRMHWYHPNMSGSWSIKDVAPTVPGGKGYGDLSEVSDGIAAQTAWFEAAAPETTEQRRNQLREALLEYCGRDTESLVTLVRFLGREP